LIGRFAQSKRYGVEKYGKAVEKRMKEFYRRLSEKDRRGYAAVESDKLGHGGQEYIAELFGIDSKTIRRGLAELELTEDASGEMIRKKGEGGSESST
jgi:hypothetical protein